MGKIIRNGTKYSGTTNSADKINYNNTLSGLEAETAQEAFDELNTKIKNGGSNIKYLTKAQYEALPDSKLTDDVEYRITDANTAAKIDATDITYGESTVADVIGEVNADLEATQNNIDTLNDNLENINNSLSVQEELAKIVTDFGNTPSRVCKKTGNVVYLNLRTYNFSNKTSVNNVAIFQLPVGFRPTKTLTVKGFVQIDGSAEKDYIPTFFYIDAAGNITSAYGGSYLQVWIVDSFII